MEHNQTPRRVVVKIGSAVIAEDGSLRPAIIRGIARDVAALIELGVAVVIVCSGAIAAGFARLGHQRVPSTVLARQAAASLGQPRLMAMWARAFARHELDVAQLLMSAADIEDRRRYLSARHTIHELLECHVVPIINENDALSEHEATIGDNDHLAALVTNLITADMLIILSQVDGVHERRGDSARADGRRLAGGKVIPIVEVGSAIDHHITEELSSSGVGGMAAKAAAAHLASDWGVRTVIARGTRAGQLQRIVEGEAVGTTFLPRKRTVTARKRWIAVRSRTHGTLTIDEGAVSALLQRGASLLPAGVINVEGNFPMGARVDVQSRAGEVIAAGLVSYGAEQIRHLAGKRRDQIAKILGFEYVGEIIHRDDLVLLGDADGG